MPSTYVRIIKAINCLLVPVILTSINNTDFRLNSDFWQLIIFSNVYDSHLSTLSTLSRENLNLQI